ncbi:MAG: hypothetical protein BWX64_00282 [Acidobacteria bacterium ADurb.Bin051]|nr:MAG: hypothetical protein BWX64_00282 [Acidobacteria bacterium ADurb.Bin051]
MRTNLSRRFVAFRDSREVPDPWGFGTVWTIRREGAAAVQRALGEIQRKNPIARAAINATARATLAASLRSGGNADELARAALEREVGRFELGEEDLERLSADAAENVLARIAGWEGLTDEDGAPIPYSEAAARELLAASDFVDDGLPYGGQELGRALSQWILEESRASEAFRGEVLEETRGN